jgi:ribosomal protein S18 acetylase RimI-like enzyme
MHPLDNPIWQSLNTVHAKFARTSGDARKFLAEVSVLAAFPEPSPENYASLASLVASGERVALFLQDPPDQPVGWAVRDRFPLLQMVYEKRALPEIDSNGVGLTPLTEEDVPEMLALTKLTKPGPFNQRTHEMGEYLGIRNAGTLAAMAGERLRIPGYTEISAVCTHPDHLGLGYATVLLKTLMKRISSRSEVAFLHVRAGNVRPIQLYERLGFTQRRLLHCSVICKDESASRE